MHKMVFTNPNNPDLHKQKRLFYICLAMFCSARSIVIWTALLRVFYRTGSNRFGLDPLSFAQHIPRGGEYRMNEECIPYFDGSVSPNDILMNNSASIEAGVITPDIRKMLGYNPFGEFENETLQ